MERTESERGWSNAMEELCEEEASQFHLCVFWTPALSQGKPPMALQVLACCRLGWAPQRSAAFKNKERGCVSFVYSRLRLSMLWSSARCHLKILEAPSGALNEMTEVLNEPGVGRVNDERDTKYEVRDSPSTDKAAATNEERDANPEIPPRLIPPLALDSGS